ncbi:Outer membrane protein TolC [bacterium A37T11]|nr:Outer membrane protein TolC [bacterium A37T11]
MLKIKENMKNLIITALFSLGLMWNTYGQEQTGSISLSESKKAALDYSRVIKNAQLNLESAQAGKQGARANYFPSISVSGAGIYGFKDFIGALPPTLEEPVNNFYAASAMATQVLYAGGKIRTANELATMQIDINRIRSRQSVDSVLLLTEQKYHGLIQVQEQWKVLKANEILLNQLLKQQEDMLASGLIARNDLLRVKVKKSKLLLDISKLENSRKIAILDFCLYIGKPYDSLLVLTDTMNTQTLPLLGYTGPNLALDSNQNYRLLQKATEAARLQTRLTRADYLPSVAVGVSATEVGVIHNPIGSKFVPIAFGTVKIPVSDWWGSGKQKIRQQQLAEKMAENRFADGQDQLKVAVWKSWYDLQDAQTQITYAKDNLAQATENLKVIQDNYASGLNTISDLLDAQALYQQAASDHIIAYANFDDKKSVYKYVIGDLRVE